MPNYNKSFNFRNGVQVDVDDLIVRGNLVGIGTTIPRADLDVHGTVDVTGIVTTNKLIVSGVSTFVDELHIGNDIRISPQSGIITGIFKGDGTGLSGLPSSQWSNDNSGGIYNSGPVGVGTTNAIKTFQVGGDPDNLLHSGVGIDSTRGNIKTTGIVTAAAFVGSGAGITAIDAQNITSGNLDTARLPTTFSGLSQVGATNLSISGIATIFTIDVTSGDITTLSATSASISNNFSVTGTSSLGVSTFSGNVGLAGSVYLVDNKKIYVGTSEDLQIYHDGSNSYISDTGTGALNISSSDGGVFIKNGSSESMADFNVNGSAALYYDNTKRFETTGVGATFTGDLNVSRNSSILGISTLTSISASDATIGVSSITNITATEIAVQKLTTSGVSTFTGAIDANGGATIDNIQIGITNNNEIDTTSGNLTIDSAGGTTTIDDNLSVSGTASIGDNTSIAGSLDVGNVAVTGILTVSSQINPTTTGVVGLGTAGTAYSDAFIGDITVGAAASNTITTRTESLTLNSAQGTVIIQDDLNVTGVSTFASLKVSNAVINTELKPNSDKSAGIGTNGSSFSEAFINEVTVGAAASNKISTREGKLLLDSTEGTVEVSNDMTVAGNLSVTGTLTAAATVNAGLAPETDKTGSIGSPSKAFLSAFINEVTVGAAVSNKISTREGKLLLDSEEGTVIVQDDFSVTGVSTFVGISSFTSAVVSTSLEPLTDYSSTVGSSSKRFGGLYVGNIRVGVGSDQEIKAQTGNLELTAPFGGVRVNNLTPVGIVTFIGDISLDGDKTRNLGSGTNAFASGHIGEVRIGSTNDNTIDTRTGELILDSNTNRVIVGGGLSASSLDVEEDVFVGSGSTSFAVLSGDQNVGIGTSIPSKSIQVVKYGDASLQLISKTANSEIILARELGSTDDSASILYDGTDFTIANGDSTGDIKFDISTGSGINTTGKFKVVHGGADLLLVDHNGLLGVNNSSPTKELDINGDLLVSNDAVVSGILTVGAGSNKITFGSGLNLINTNIDATSLTGVSTILTLDSIDITSQNLKVTIGIGTFLTGGTIGTDAQAFVADNTSGDALTVRGSTSIRSNLFAAYAGSDIGIVGIGTTNYPTDNRDTNTTGNLNLVDYGIFSITGNMSVVGEEDSGTCIFVPSKNVSSVPTLKKGNVESEYSWTREFKVGINTYIPRSAFDIGACNSPMIVPSLSQQSITDLVTIPNSGTITDPALPSNSGTQVIGALFFSKPENRLKVGLATANSEDSYVGILTATTNSSDFEAISFPQMSTSNRDTMNGAGGIPNGSVIYNTSTNKLQVKANGTFVNLH